MSDLGQFVAATIRDKVILELLQENAKLKDLLRQQSQVEICGTNGSPVFFRAYQSLDRTYMIDDSFEPQSMSFPLRNLADIEIRIGGLFLSQLLSRSLHGTCERDETIELYFDKKVCGKKFTIVLVAKIEGWSDERQSSLERVQPERFVESLVHSFPLGTSEAKVKLLDISVQVVE